MLGVQFTFVSSIDTSIAVIATLFQFLAPIYIIVFVSWMHRKLPPIAQVLGMLVTLAGLFLLLTNGSLSGISLSPITIFWGIAVGLVYALPSTFNARVGSARSRRLGDGDWWACFVNYATHSNY